MKNWQTNHIDQELIRLSLQEDLGKPFLDATTQHLFGTQHDKTAVKIISKHPENMVLAGLPVVEAVLQEFKQPFEIKSDYQDGDMIKPGKKVLRIEGEQQSLLMAERTLLNFLQHLCAIATVTRQFVDAVKHTHLKILDTRKTLPGFRHLDKHAVLCGGGVNHRMGLYDALMIKDTHVDILGGMQQTLEKLPNDILENYPVIVEVRDQQELDTALQYGENKITRVLLDNMTNDELIECVALCDGKMPTEASGNVNLSTIKGIAETGVDYASVGMITHSAGRIDLSMKADNT